MRACVACAAAASRAAAVPAAAAPPPPLMLGPIPLGPLIEEATNRSFRIRDVVVALAGDGMYYLTGTTTLALECCPSPPPPGCTMPPVDGCPQDERAVIRMWSSPTLRTGGWRGGGVVYNVSRDCRWCGPDAATCPLLWSPKFHYLPSKAADVPGSGGYFMSYQHHRCGAATANGLLRSSTGRPDGPYEELFHGGYPGNSPFVFRDADGACYLVSGRYDGWWLTQLSRNMSGVVGAPYHLQGPLTTDSDLVGFEAPSMVLVNGTYFMYGAAFGNRTGHGGPGSPYNPQPPNNGSGLYNTYAASSASLRGPWSPSWLAVEAGGSSVIFPDHDGDLWATLFYGSSFANLPRRAAPYVDEPAVVRVGVRGGRLVALADPTDLPPPARGGAGGAGGRW